MGAKSEVNVAENALGYYFNEMAEDIFVNPGWLKEMLTWKGARYNFLSLLIALVAPKIPPLLTLQASLKPWSRTTLPERLRHLATWVPLPLARTHYGWRNRSACRSRRATDWVTSEKESGATT